MAMKIDILKLKPKNSKYDDEEDLDLDMEDDPLMDVEDDLSEYEDEVDEDDDYSSSAIETALETFAESLGIDSDMIDSSKAVRALKALLKHC